jgi:flagellar hook-associated protein 1 FlgK
MAAESLQILPLTVQELALSSTTNPAPGNSGQAKILSELANLPIAFSNLGNMTFSEAFAAITGNLAISSQQVNIEKNGNQEVLNQIIANKESVSGVNSDEEAAKLMEYTNNYNANMKVISTANSLFNSILNSF